MIAPDQEWTFGQWELKRAWHERQRTLPLREKIAVVMQLQRRQQSINIGKTALGLPTISMRVWNTRP